MHNKQAASQVHSGVSTGRFQGWLIWGLAAAFFFCDYFARVSIGVIVDDLALSFHMNSQVLGTLSAFFYIPYVAMQIPVGMLVDRFGVRPLLISMCLLTGLACSLFGAANHLWILELSRFLLGFGSAFAFVSALKLASEWFPASQLGLLAGLTQALGMVGAAVGAYPVALLVSQIGWRYTMHTMAIVFAILCVLIALFVFDKNDPQTTSTRQQSTKRNMLKGLGVVLKNPQSWINALYAGLLFAPTGALAEFWGPTYFAHIQKLSATQAALINGMIFVGWGIGGPLMGWLSDRIRRRKIIMLGSAITGFIILSVALYYPDLTTKQLLILLLLFGVSNNGVAIAYAVASEINPNSVSGMSIAFANMMSVIIGTILLPVIGWLIDWQHGQVFVDGKITFDSTVLKSSMLVLPGCLLASVVMLFGFRETFCQSLEARRLVVRT